MNYRILNITGIFIFLIFLSTNCTQNKQTLPTGLNDYVDSIIYGQLGNTKPDINYSEISDNTFKVIVSFELNDSVLQDDWQVNITPAFCPDFHWAPHLTPTNEHIIAQHVFRAPAMVVSSGDKKITVIPDLSLIKNENSVNWYMDLDAPNNKLTLGLSNSEIREHVLYVRKPGAVHLPGKVEFGFYILVSDDKIDIRNPWRDVVTFLWNKWGYTEYRTFVYEMKNVEEYVEYTYNWAFNSWKESVWQEFEVDGKEVGAPVFIVNTTQSPNYQGEVNEREFRSIWNQAWFNSLRSASGLYRYGRRTKNNELIDYALKTKELALSFPQEKGFFPGVIATEMELIEINGEKYNRSKGWDSYYYGNSNRNPYTLDTRISPYHILDMSFTANQMLTWYSELEQDQRLLNYATTYADALIGIQYEDGFFPAWLSPELSPMEHLNKSPESAMSVTFLLNLHRITENPKYLNSALEGMDAIIDNIIYNGQWEDFETYWSCSRYGSDNLVGKKVKRNNQFKQNTLSIYWTAEALLNSFKLTSDKKYLELGERTIDELLMYQAAWQPPFIYIRAIGGFGVMNADAEWNDSRQSLFSELIINYGEVLGRKEYIQRGLSALYASFEMMYCPENSSAKEQWEKVWPFFNEKDYGFMMENYGHNGVTSNEGIGVGEFTIYDWGNGAASEAYNRIVDHYGKNFVEHPSIENNLRDIEN